MEKGKIQNKAFKGVTENKEDSAVVAVVPLHYKGKIYEIGAELIVDTVALEDLVLRNRVTRKNDGQ